MEFRLFGKSLFEARKSQSMMYIGNANNTLKESKYLPDFYVIGNNVDGFNSAVWMNVPSSEGSLVMQKVDPEKEKPKAKPVTTHLTPKGVYDLKMLHDKSFKLNTDPTYVEGQIADFKDKLSLIKAEEYDMRRGTEEIASVLIRMENRKKYRDVKSFFEEYPYTTTSKIADVIKEHDYLKMGQVAQFMADMPKEAVSAMKGYNEHTKKICGKQAVFYIVADKKDFQKTNTRRDPILLAQSPFGHFWQILGAWDKEMLFVEEL